MKGSYVRVGATELIARRGYGGMGDYGGWNPRGQAMNIGHGATYGGWRTGGTAIPIKNGHGSLGALNIPDWGWAVGLAAGAYLLLKAFK